jgi:hypothetical protein
VDDGVELCAAAQQLADAAVATHEGWVVQQHRQDATLEQGTGAVGCRCGS